MSSFLNTLPVWPAGKPFPAGAISLFYDPNTDKEYRLDISRLGNSGAGASGAPQWVKDRPYPEGTLIYDQHLVYRASRDIAPSATAPGADVSWEVVGGGSGVAIATPQWLSGAQKEGALVFDQGYIYRVRVDRANSTVAPAGNPSTYLLIGPGTGTPATSAGPYYVEYPAPADGVQTITPAAIAGLAQATAISVVGLRAADGSLEPVFAPGTGYTFDAATKTVKVIAGDQQPGDAVKAGDVVVIGYLTGVVGAPAAPTAAQILALIDTVNSNVSVTLVGGLLVFNATGGPDTSGIYTPTYDTAAKYSTTGSLFSEVADLTTRINSL